MSILPAAIMAVGLGMQFKAQQDAGKAQQSAYNYNASIARRQAAQAHEAGKLEAYRQRKAARAFSAKQRAAYSAAGVRGIGSPLEVQYNDFAELEMDAIITEMNAQNQASMFMSEAEYDEWRGKQARRAANISAYGTLLTSLGTLGLTHGVPRLTSSPVSSSSGAGIIRHGGPARLTP